MAMHQERLAWMRLEGNVSHGALAVWAQIPFSHRSEQCNPPPRNLSSLSSVSSETQRKILQSMNPAPGLQCKILHTSPKELSSDTVHPMQGKGGCMPLRTLTFINCGFCCRCSLNSWFNHERQISEVETQVILTRQWVGKSKKSERVNKSWWADRSWWKFQMEREEATGRKQCLETSWV